MNFVVFCWGDNFWGETNVPKELSSGGIDVRELEERKEEDKVVDI